MKSIETGVWGAYQNVLINLKDVKDDDVREKVGLDQLTTRQYIGWHRKTGLYRLLWGKL